MNIHTFNVEIAERYGLAEAIILQNLSFWCAKNAANRTNYQDGKYWTYNSVAAFSELFPYLTKSKISRALKSLEADGLIIIGCYNKSAYDRTRWYALTNEAWALFGKSMVDGVLVSNSSISQNVKMEEPKQANQTHQNEPPIPDVTTDVDPYVKPDSKDPVSEFAGGDERLETAIREFIAMRKRIKAPLTDYGLTRILAKVASYATDKSTQAAILDQSTERCWRGVFPLKDSPGAGGGTTIETGWDVELRKAGII